MQNEAPDKTPETTPDTPKREWKLSMLLGFRSGKPWKKIIACLYYAVCLLVLITGMVTPPLVPAGMRDVIVFKVSVIVIFLWMLTPAIALSNTPMRDKMPFLRDRLWMRSLLGMCIIFIILAYLFVTIESMHTPEYRTALEAYNIGLFGPYWPQPN